MVVSFGPSESIVFNQKSFIIKVLSLSSNVWFIRVIFDCFLDHLEPLMILQALSCMQTTCPLWHSQARWLSTHNLQPPVRNLSTQKRKLTFLWERKICPRNGHFPQNLLKQSCFHEMPHNDRNSEAPWTPSDKFLAPHPTSAPGNITIKLIRHRTELSITLSSHEDSDQQFKNIHSCLGPVAWFLEYWLKINQIKANGPN